MSSQHFNAAQEIAQMKQQRTQRRHKRYHSRLNDFRQEIIELLKAENCSYRLVAEWLQSKKRFKVSHTTIMRFARNLPEFQLILSSETQQEIQEEMKSETYAEIETAITTKSETDTDTKTATKIETKNHQKSLKEEKQNAELS